MNFLAHVFISSASDGEIVGALLGDFVKGRAKDEYPDEVRRGIELHRAVDSFTDSHDLTVDSRRLFPPERRRVSGILIDVVNDHFLASNWDSFSDVSLEAFAARVYAACDNHRELLPERFQKMFPYMRQENWLSAYRELSWIELTLSRMEQRRNGRIALAAGIHDIRENYLELERNFLSFFPQVIHFAAEMNRKSELGGIESPSK